VQVDRSGNNFAFDLPQANAKALGLRAANDPASDGNITFSSNFSWDFDRSNGISGGTFDFFGVAAHEIGHLLGFVSGVDTVDIAGGNGPFAPLDLENFRVFSAIDLLRYTDDSLSQPDQPLGGLNDFAFGQPSAGDRPFFSIDGGATELATFSGNVRFRWKLAGDRPRPEYCADPRANVDHACCAGHDG